MYFSNYEMCAFCKSNIRRAVVGYLKQNAENLFTSNKILHLFRTTGIPIFLSAQILKILTALP